VFTSLLLTTLQFEDEVTLLADRLCHFEMGRLDVTELAAVLGDIFVLYALFIKEAMGVGFAGSVLSRERQIRLQVRRNTLR
jgi:hypothetical protein